MFMWFKEKDKKYLAFLNSPTFREHYDLGEKCVLVKKQKKNALYNTELNYKQLWCAPLPLEVQPGEKK